MGLESEKNAARTNVFTHAVVRRRLLFFRALIFFPGAKLFLIFLSAIFFCFALPGQTTNYYEFAKSLPKLGSTEWEINNRQNQERQELYRKRVAISDAVGADVPRDVSADLINGPAIVAAARPAASASDESLGNLFYVMIVLALVAFLTTRRLNPQILHDLNQWLNPWAAPPALEKAFAGQVRTEEKQFNEFLTTFRAGPDAANADLNAPAARHEEFYARLKKRLAAQRKWLAEIKDEPRDAARKKLLVTQYFELGALKADAEFPAALPIWQVAAALEGLFKQLNEKMNNFTPSTLRTIGGGLDLLAGLSEPGLRPDLLTNPPFKFLVVDDDLISRQALSLSLKKAFSEPDLAEDGAAALALARQQAYDVIFLDVQMPGMDGYELCRKIRSSTRNGTTPVIFVTSHADFDARAKSTLSGGNDLMGKPFLIFEVTVKALTLAMQGRLEKPVPPAEMRANQMVPVLINPRVANRPATVRRPASSPATEMNAATGAFMTRATLQLAALRELGQLLLQTSDEAVRQSLLADAFVRLSTLIAASDGEVEHPAFQVGVALDGLIKKLLENSAHSTPATLATVVAAVDLLSDLCVPGMKPDLAVNPPVELLVVDDDLIARRVLVGGLQTFFHKPESVENGEAALARAQEKQFDVIFLDVQMPGLNGFEVCSKIRETSFNRATPVVFITAHGDAAARDRTNECSGDDLMEKPCLPAEINVKALTFALRSRLQQIKLPSAF